MCVEWFASSDGFGARLFLARFVGRQMVMDIYFGNVPFLLLSRFVKILSFHYLMREDKAHWSRCLLWHGWLPMLSGVNGALPWAADASERAHHLVETALGRYSSGLVSEWSLPDGFDADEVAARMCVDPEVWSDGVLVCLLTNLSIAGVIAGGVILIVCSWIMWLILVGVLSVPGPLQTVQRAELWGDHSCSSVF